MCYDFVMRAPDFHAFTRRQPFLPFRLHTSAGRVYDIRHPDQVIPLRSKVIIGIPNDDGVPEHDEHISMNHVVRLEPSPEAEREAG